jgi:hypothetical protein
MNNQLSLVIINLLIVIEMAKFDLKRSWVVVLFVIPALINSCNQKYDQPAGSGGWLQGDVSEKFETVAGHLGGFGRAMWEVDYRFRELYWAGKDMNWEYAGHQIHELEETITKGLERRPERAASSQQFINSAIPDLEKAIEAKDPEIFERRFMVMLNTCNSCHALENMPFLTVKVPQARGSSIR